MKYKLLKDTPTIKAGTIFEEIVSMSDGTRELAVAVPGEDIPEDPQFAIQDIDNFYEWFEEIQEPTDSIHWEPKIGDRYFYISGYGTVYSETWHGVPVDYYRRALGFICPTEEECRKAKERRLAEVRLQRTSNFEPDFEDCRGGWVVYYNYKDKELYTYDTDYDDSGEIVRYATKEEAEKSIIENREDWMKHFGVKE